MKLALIIPALAILSALALFVGAVVSTNAGHHGYFMFGATINEMDANDDGKISFDEYSAFHSEKLRWSFDAIDIDNDNAISSEEWETLLKMHGAGKGYGHDQQG